MRLSQEAKRVGGGGGEEESQRGRSTWGVYYEVRKKELGVLLEKVVASF